MQFVNETVKSLKKDRPQVSALECSPFSLFTPFTLDTGVQISFCNILRNMYSAVSLAE